jgi:cyclohexanecarboxylate-CoA ligase
LIDLDPRLRPDSRLTPALIERYESDGTWQRRTLRSFLSHSAAWYPNTLAAVGYRGGRLDEDSALTYSELDALSSALATGLRSLGVAAGDVVAVMSRNRVEFGALIFAINEIGATYTGIPATYGAREVRQILSQSEAAVVVAEEGTSASIVRGLRDELPALRHVVVMAENSARAPVELGSGEVSYSDVLRHEVPGAADDDYAAVCHIGFTSGTTGAPKGVMNTAQTLESILRSWVDHVGGPDALGEPLVNLVASPVGHHTGFCWGVLLSAYLGGTSVHLDRWQTLVARAAIEEQRVTAMFCAPTFVQDLIAGGAPAPGDSLTMITVAGAPVPRSLPVVAGQALGCAICPAWGMTEYAIGVSWKPALGPGALDTDGVAAPGAEIRVVAPAGEPVDAAEGGDFQLRGPGLFLGYFRRPEENAASFVDGWFRTGDTANIDSGGYVRFVGRSKDIVIRGGENVPVVAVESLLFGHPKVRDVAIIGVPDERLGQRACAVVVAAPGESPTLPELCDALLDQGLSTRYLPERLELVEELPKTPSGKIRKVELRERFG